MIRLAVWVLLLGACNEICEEEPTPGIAASRGTASGSIELQAASVPFATPFEGEVRDDGSQATALTISEGAVYMDVEIPDLRTLQGAATVTVPVDGSITVGDGYCNFSGVGTLTIAQATGSQAPAPQFVTADFARSADLVVAIDTCPSRLVVHATVALTANSYSAVEHTVNCPDLSK